MKKPDDHTLYREWLHAEIDGCLTGSQRAELERHLVACAACRTEREDLLAFAKLMQRNRIPVRDEFKQNVFAALPTVGWENRHPKTWGFPAAAAVLLAGIAAMLYGSAHLGTGPGISVLLAMADMFGSTVQAGAGLLAATWKGLGMAFEEVISSPLSLGALSMLVICLQLLLFSLLRRRRSAVRGGRR